MLCVLVLLLFFLGCQGPIIHLGVPVARLSGSACPASTFAMLAAFVRRLGTAFLVSLRPSCDIYRAAAVGAHTLG